MRYIPGYLSCISATAKPLINRLTKMRLKVDDFETLNIIGRGAFGEVCVYITLCQFLAMT